MSLSPSQRISVISGIAKQLRTEQWSLIDLTLKQFGLPWADVWNGYPDGYVLAMIDKASDQTLIELAQHVGLSAEGRQLRTSSLLFGARECFASSYRI